MPASKSIEEILAHPRNIIPSTSANTSTGVDSDIQEESKDIASMGLGSKKNR